MSDTLSRPLETAVIEDAEELERLLYETCADIALKGVRKGESVLWYFIQPAYVLVLAKVPETLRAYRIFGGGSPKERQNLGKQVYKNLFGVIVNQIGPKFLSIDVPFGEIE